MAPNIENDKEVRNWLSKSTTDLESAKVLYDHKLFANALYHLQQSNEKLAKGLLISIGILTPKAAKKDLRVKSLLGFMPKEPTSYRHRTLPALLSDMEKSFPFIEEYLTILESGNFGPKIAEAHNTIRASKKGVQKLKKKPFGLIQKTEQLETEIKTAQALLGSMEQAEKKVKTELAKLDPEEMMRAAIFLVRKAGFKGDVGQPINFSKITAEIIPTIRITVLAMLSVAIASFLDPLESVTRYPNSQQVSFDETNPYIIHFEGIHNVIACILEKSR